jgi:RHS repeat-associated protein
VRTVNVVSKKSHRRNRRVASLCSSCYKKNKSLERTSFNNCTHVADCKLCRNSLRSFQYGAENRLSKVILGSTVVGTGFVNWLRTNFSWLWATAQTNATLGDSYLYADGSLPSWALLGEYGNGGVSSTGRTEYIWLPTQDGSAIPVGLYRSGKLHAIHTDHLGTPRLITNETNTPQWQWPYSAFGDNAPTGILKPTTSAGSAFTSILASQGGATTTATLLATSAPTQINNLRFPGQYADSETGLFYNYYRSYQATQGRYTQNDPIGLDGGWNRFGYVEGNPISYMDAKGESPTFVGVIAIGGIAYGAYETYTKFKIFKQNVQACEAQCEIRACGDPERSSMLENNQARCIQTCKSYTMLEDLFSVGKGPTGPQAPAKTPNIFKP